MKIDFSKRCEEFVSNPGDKFHPVCHGRILDDGTIDLVVDRLENTDDVIDSFRQSTEIYNIISRIEAGEVGLLHQMPGFYGDVTDLPKNYAEMLDLMKRGEDFFNKLPVDVKVKYNNDFNQFFAHFDEAMAELAPKDQAAAADVSDLAIDKEVKE